MAIVLLFGMLGVLLVIGVPVAYALAAAALSTLLYLGLPTIVLVQQMAAGAGTASLIAIPLFIFAGEIMLRGGISERLIALAGSLVGRLRGGLGQVSILSSLFFGGVSGSAIADVSAVGGTMIPQMVQRGYDRGAFGAGHRPGAPRRLSMPVHMLRHDVDRTGEVTHGADTSGAESTTQSYATSLAQARVEPDQVTA